MSRVRVLVGTRKGAFILTSDGKRKNWEVSGPHFAGWEIYHMKGSPVDPNRIYASQTSGWFGQIIQRSDDGGKTWSTPGSSPDDLKGPEGMPKGESNKFVYDGVPGTHQVVRRHAASVGIQARLASRAVAARSGSRLCRRGRCRAVQIHRRRQDMEGIVGTAQTRYRPEVAAGRGRNVSAHDSARSKRIRNEFSSRSPPRARSAPMTAAKRGSRSIEVCNRNSCPIRTRKSATAFIASRCIRPSRRRLFMQKHWDVMRSDNAGDSWHEVSGNLPTDFGFPIDVHAHEPETIYVVPDQERFRAFPARRQTARLSQPHRRQRMGSAHQRPAAKRLLRERAARRDVRRFARSVRHLFRHNRRPGLRIGRWRRLVESDRARSSGGFIGRSADVILKKSNPRHQSQTGSNDQIPNQARACPAIF